MVRGPRRGQEQRREDDPHRWRYFAATLTVVVMLGLVVYVTVRTGEIPYEVAVPLLGGAAWALYNYRASGTGGD